MQSKLVCDENERPKNAMLIASRDIADVLSFSCQNNTCSIFVIVRSKAETVGFQLLIIIGSLFRDVDVFFIILMQVTSTIPVFLLRSDAIHSKASVNCTTQSSFGGRGSLRCSASNPHRYFSCVFSLVSAYQFAFNKYKRHI